MASLLDHMDWMPDRDINQEVCHLFQKMDRKRGKIYWRTFADDVHAAPLHWLKPTRVGHADDDDRYTLIIRIHLHTFRQLDARRTIA